MERHGLARAEVGENEAEALRPGAACERGLSAYTSLTGPGCRRLNGDSVVEKAGWGTWIRTKIDGVRVR